MDGPDLDLPICCPFSLTEEPREVITGEPVMPDGHHALPEYEDVDWIGPANMGGGHVPDDYQWPSGPRERQEREGMG
ncbi:MAG TPA: hypothetical protein VFA20_11435 [Myxococcaceae bacterium]|nr:hypothetical protein [Myxococcaceae bacterium]